jgi:hypothetical protein
MPDIEGRYRSFLRTGGRDLWPEISSREPSHDISSPLPWGRRIAGVILALLVAAAGLAISVRAFEAPDPSEPVGSQPSPPTIHGELVARLQVGPRGQVTDVYSAAGHVWVTGYGVRTEEDEVLRRIDPATNNVDATTDLPAGLPAHEVGGGGIAFGNGSLWVIGRRPAGATSEATLQRVNPATGEVQATIPLSGTDTADVAINASGVWVASFSTQSSPQPAELARIDPSTNEIVESTTLAETYVRRVVAVSDAVVVEEKASSGGVFTDTVLEVVDPASNSIVAHSGSTAWGAGGDIVGWSDEVWATLEDGFTRVNLSTAEPIGSAVGDLGSLPVVLGSSEAAIWFWTDGGLAWFDPETGASDIAVAGMDFVPIAGTVDNNSVWLLSFDGKLAHIHLS